MHDDPSIVTLHSAKDHFTVELKILTNVGLLVPDKKIDPRAEYGVVVVRIGEESDFLGLGEFIEFHKFVLDLTPRADGTFALCATICFPLPEEGEADEDEPLPDFLKMYATMPVGAGVKEFLDMVRSKKMYYAVFSTPEYDGRIVVKYKTGLVSSKAYEERLYKVQ
jgi:hypothetical protein